MIYLMKYNLYGSLLKNNERKMNYFNVEFFYCSLSIPIDS